MLCSVTTVTTIVSLWCFAFAHVMCASHCRGYIALSISRHQQDKWLGHQLDLLYLPAYEIVCFYHQTWVSWPLVRLSEFWLELDIKSRTDCCDHRASRRDSFIQLWSTTTYTNHTGGNTYPCTDNTPPIVSSLVNGSHVHYRSERGPTSAYQQESALVPACYFYS